MRIIHEQILTAAGRAALATAAEAKAAEIAGRANEAYQAPVVVGELATDFDVGKAHER